MRVVSLLASATEVVCELGQGESLVGRSHECDYPQWVRRLPSLSRPSFDISGSSADIDGHVRRKLAAGEPLYVVDEAALAALAPDVLLTQTHCEVCAVTPGDMAPSLCRQPVAALRTGTLAGILEGCGTELVARCQGIVDRVTPTSATASSACSPPGCGSSRASYA